MAASAFRDQRQPLLLEEEPDYVSYDDDELQGAARLRRKKKRVRACLCMSLGVFVIALVGVGLFFGTNGMKQSPKPAPGGDSKFRYKHAAVASDVTLCSQIGRDILEKSGGNAVDAALATLLCMGLADPQSMGIGGGFFMTIYNRTTGRSVAIDARETAPAKATKDMYYNNPDASTYGGLAIGVPGEIRGYEMAHQFASLPWGDLFQPAIGMARDGFKVPRSLENALQDLTVERPNWKTELPLFVKTYTNPDTGRLYKEGEVLRLPELAQTLSTLAQEGADAFYDGSLTQAILDDMGYNNSGAIITADDLKQYKPTLNSALNVTLTNGYTVHAPGPPSSGAILMFILNILDGFNMTAKDFVTLEQKTVAHHRIIEAFKFAYAKRTGLADEGFNNTQVPQLVANLTSRSYADMIRAKIWDNQTHGVMYYGPTFYNRTTTSTAHLSVVDQFGNAVSVTSTVNTRFGSKVFGEKTGIVFNNEMDDFATSDKPNDFGIYPSPANMIVPGKRPLSSMCPSVIVDKNGQVVQVVGAAGGSRITTATAYVASRVLWFGESIKAAIDALRLHHQLLPAAVSYETGFDKDILEGLKMKGHNLTKVGIGKSIVQGIARQGDFFYANSDYRKGGTPDGF